MMKVERVITRKNSADITVDGVLYNKLPLSEVIRYGIKADTEIDETDFNKFLAECDKTSAKEYLFGLIARGAKTEKEARIRLYQKGFRKESVINAIELAKQYKYIWDELYADAYVQINRQSKGTYRIKYELKQKGVKDEIIEGATFGLNTTEKESALAVASRFANGKDLTERKVKEKIMRQLASRGFAYDIIKDVLASLGAKVEDFED